MLLHCNTYAFATPTRNYRKNIRTIWNYKLIAPISQTQEDHVKTNKIKFQKVSKISIFLTFCHIRKRYGSHACIHKNKGSHTRYDILHKTKHLREVATSLRYNIFIQLPQIEYLLNLNTLQLQRHIAMLLWRISLILVSRHLQSLDQAYSGITRRYYLVNISQTCCRHRVRKLLTIFCNLLFTVFR